MCGTLKADKGVSERWLKKVNRMFIATSSDGAELEIQNILEVVSSLAGASCVICDPESRVIAATGIYASYVGSVADLLKIDPEKGSQASVYALHVHEDTIYNLVTDSQDASRFMDRAEASPRFLTAVTSIERAIATSLEHAGINARIVAAREQIKGVVQAISEGIMAIDSDGIVICCNRAGAQILDVRIEDFVGRRLVEVSPNAPILGVVHSGFGYVNREVTISTTHGPRRVLATATPIISSAGLVGAVALMKTSEEMHRLAYDMSESQPDYSIDRILGASEQIQVAKRLALRAAATSSPVLLRGESGTGKELFARAIHRHSSRVLGPFIAVNCAAIPDELLESELFGYEEGAFTGARRGGKPGKFELADQGTLFLDEVGNCSLNLQAKLLRVLDNHEVTRLGGTEEIRVNVRVISASNRDLEARSKSREFREDLFFRLSVIPVEIPPLRDRSGDIDMLFHHMLAAYAKESGVRVPRVSETALSRLLAYQWPGNVRELQNAVQFALSFDRDGVIGLDDLPAKLTDVESSHPSDTHEDSRSKQISRHEWERREIEAGLRLLGSSHKAKVELAAKLGMGRSTLYRKIREYGLESPDRPNS